MHNIHTQMHILYLHTWVEKSNHAFKPTKTHLNGFVNMESKWSRKWHKNIPGSFLVYLKDNLTKGIQP